jgi:hypothetical protein
MDATQNILNTLWLVLVFIFGIMVLGLLTQILDEQKKAQQDGEESARRTTAEDLIIIQVRGRCRRHPHAFSFLLNNMI